MMMLSAIALVLGTATLVTAFSTSFGQDLILAIVVCLS
jgi:hypothetical protein